MGWQQYLACKNFFFWSENKILPIVIIGLVVLLVAWFWGLVLAPIDVQQGNAYRMIFVHVPAASGGMAVYLGISIAAVLSWIWQIKLADIILAAFAPIGAVLTFLALVTGAIWGKPMWGAWWVWDARLTSCLILLFFYMGIIILRHSMGDNESAAKACGLLTVVGVVNLPIVHYSVNWWNTLHQPASILAFKHPTIASVMLWPLLLSMFGLAVWVMGFGLLNMRRIILLRYNYQVYIKDWVSKC